MKTIEKDGTIENYDSIYIIVLFEYFVCIKTEYKVGIIFLPYYVLNTVLNFSGIHLKYRLTLNFSHDLEQ